MQDITPTIISKQMQPRESSKIFKKQKYMILYTWIIIYSCICNLQNKKWKKKEEIALPH